MPMTQNQAAWLPGVGEPLEIRPAPLPVPSKGELLIKVMAVAVQPAEYKIQEGILPFHLTYPTIIGLSFSGIIVEVGPDVVRFRPGDRVVTNSGGTIRNDARFGGYQNYALTTQELTAKIGDVPFQTAASISNLYGAASALVLHLHLDKPSKNPKPENKHEKILVWGASSSFGIYATQLAREAGYTIVGVASGHNEEVVRSSGAAYFVDRRAQTASQNLIALGPYKAVLAAADSAEDQVVIGEVLAALGGGSFLSTMGVRSGVKLPEGVTGRFVQYLDDYLNGKNEEFTKWLWWGYMEGALESGQLKLVPVRELGGLSQVQTAWDLLKHGKVSGQRLIISPNME